MSNTFYDTLDVSKTASQDEIKKAYRKQAMKYHPDRNKGDKSAEKQFKKVNEAYSTLSDSSKKKQYDTFWSTWWNPFSWWGGNYSSGGFWWFEDMFWGFWWWWNSSSWGINMEDLFWWWASSWWFWDSRRTKVKEKPISLDFDKVYEVPVFDLILWCKIEVRWVYGQTAKLKIPASTIPWTKFRVKDFWKSEGFKKWNLIVKVNALMPKNISDVDMSMLERIRENIGY